MLKHRQDETRSLLALSGHGDSYSNKQPPFQKPTAVSQSDQPCNRRIYDVAFVIHWYECHQGKPHPFFYPFFAVKRPQPDRCRSWKSRIQSFRKISRRSWETSCAFCCCSLAAVRFPSSLIALGLDSHGIFLLPTKHVPPPRQPGLNG